jgi:hypothetical protein
MNTINIASLSRAFACAALVASFMGAFAQGFNAGSDGSLGDVVIDAHTTIPLPPDGKLHYKSLTVNSGVRVTFQKNLRNTPVFILSQGDVIVNGIIAVNGSSAPDNTGGTGGPGGFDGGKPGFGAEVPPGFGFGPGGAPGGPGGCGNVGDAGGGSYGSIGTVGGPAYGSALLIPIIGGSGGGGGAGQPGLGGGGGGGAILIAANTRITVSGTIESRGGANRTCLNGGSGGAIRMVSFKVEGAGLLDVRGGGNGGHGRIRIDTIDRSNINFNFQTAGVTTVGGNLIALQPVIPTLATVEAAGNPVAQGGGPVTFTLPFGSTPNRTVKIQAKDFGRLVPIRVTLTPDSGSPVTVDAEIDNTGPGAAIVEVPITVPVNTLVTVHAWTR